MLVTEQVGGINMAAAIVAQMKELAAAQRYLLSTTTAKSYFVCLNRNGRKFSCNHATP